MFVWYFKVIIRNNQAFLQAFKRLSISSLNTKNITIKRNLLHLNANYNNVIKRNALRLNAIIISVIKTSTKHRRNHYRV